MKNFTCTLLLCFLFAAIAFPQPCETCPNNMSVFIAGLTNGDNTCLDTNKSFVSFETESGTQSINFQNTGGGGYTAFLPFDLICDDSQIELTLCKYPPLVALCTYSTFQYIAFVTFVGGGYQTVNISEPVPESLCLDDHLIGYFNCCIEGTTSCKFVPWQ